VVKQTIFEIIEKCRKGKSGSAASYLSKKVGIVGHSNQKVGHFSKKVGHFIP